MQGLSGRYEDYVGYGEVEMLYVELGEGGNCKRVRRIETIDQRVFLIASADAICRLSAGVLYNEAEAEDVLQDSL